MWVHVVVPGEWAKDGGMVMALIDWMVSSPGKKELAARIT
jgi:hypothetical protein